MENEKRLMSRPIARRNRSCHVARADASHELLRCCWKASIDYSIEKKIKIKQENEVVATMKAEQCQDEVSSGNKRKRGKYQTKIENSLLTKSDATLQWPNSFCAHHPFHPQAPFETIAARA